MKQIRLELNSIKILKNRERWNLYFVIATEHPDNPEKTVILVKPEEDGYIPFRNKTDNFYSFKPEGDNTEGLFLIERELPEDSSIEVLFTLMHSRTFLRKLGDKLKEVKEVIGDDKSIVEKVIGLGQPYWLVINKAIGVVGNILKDVNDRNLGALSMCEDFEGATRQDRTQKLSSGNAEISWTWNCKDV